VSESQKAKALASKIFEFINSLNLNSIPIIAQSYDGAAVMSGCKNGIQTKIKQKHPEAIYIHCMAHKLNLVVVDTCNFIKVSKFIKCIEYRLWTIVDRTFGYNKIFCVFSVCKKCIQYNQSSLCPFFSPFY